MLDATFWFAHNRGKKALFFSFFLPKKTPTPSKTGPYHVGFSLHESCLVCIVMNRIRVGMPPKHKKCSTCNKYPHSCEGTRRGWGCKCIRRGCCVCAQPSSAPFPRPCPCTKPECVKTWAEETKNERDDDDEDFIVFHCACHAISHGKTSFHCECSEWVCQNCAHDQALPSSLGVDSEAFGPLHEVMCTSCYENWLRHTLRDKAVKLIAYADSELAKLGQASNEHEKQ